MAKWDQFLSDIKFRFAHWWNPTEVPDNVSSGRERGILDELSSYFWFAIDWLFNLDKTFFYHVRVSYGVVEYWCSPEANTDAELLNKVTQSVAQIMDRLLRRRSIDRIYIYAMSSIPDEHTGERIRKGVILELDRPGLRDADMEGGLEEMVLSDPQRFLELCNLRWVDPKEIPEVPLSRGP